MVNQTARRTSGVRLAGINIPIRSSAKSPPKELLLNCASVKSSYVGMRLHYLSRRRKGRELHRQGKNLESTIKKKKAIVLSGACMCKGPAAEPPMAPVSNPFCLGILGCFLVGELSSPHCCSLSSLSSRLFIVAACPWLIAHAQIP
jgi:hypothetical protein